MALAERGNLGSFKTDVEWGDVRDSKAGAMAKSLFDGGFDQLDRAIVEALQVNSRISVADLARKIHLSPPAVHQRIKRLERAGVIEHVLYKHPVEMCAIVGVPDSTWGEVGKAFIVLKAGPQVSEDDLFLHMRHCLAGYKVPHSVEIRSSLPISAAGKILKRALVNPETSHES